MEPFFGKAIANGLIVFVFTGLHLGVTYTRDQLLFLVILVPLAYLWGFFIQKTNTIWGFVLFHAGMDPDLENTWIVIGDTSPDAEGREQYAHELDMTIAPLLRSVIFGSN